jgi:hypothetical protein
MPLVCAAHACDPRGCGDDGEDPGRTGEAEVLLMKVVAMRKGTRNFRRIEDRRKNVGAPLRTLAWFGGFVPRFQIAEQAILLGWLVEQPPRRMLFREFVKLKGRTYATITSGQGGDSAYILRACRFSRSRVDWCHDSVRQKRPHARWSLCYANCRY